MSQRRVLQAVQAKQAFLLTAHVNADADAIGSEIALARGLRWLGKRAEILNHDPLPRVLRFLDFPPRNGLFQRSWRRARPDVRAYEVLVVMDCGDLERTGLFSRGYAPPLIINIDHHATNRQFGDINWVSAEAAATAEMIHALLKALRVPITPEIATALYTALVAETGSFRYSNTTPRIFRLAAELAGHGAEPWRVAQSLYEENSPARLRLLSALLRRMARTPDGTVAWVTLTRALLRQTGATQEDAEEFVNFPRSLEGAEAAVLIREVAPRSYKMSLRSKGRVDVAAVAERFGGGGHRAAAGCRLEGPLSAVTRTIIQAVQRETRTRHGRRAEHQ